MANINDLRAQVLKRHQAANAKANRLKAKGVEVAGTGFDPRRPPANIQRYNRKQLEAYERKLNLFTDRKTQFVAGHEGMPITKESFDTYKRFERAFTIRGEKFTLEYANTFLMDSDQTVGQRHADMEADTARRARMGGNFTNAPFYRMNRSAENIRGEAGVEKLTRDLQNKLRPAYRKRKLLNDRKAFASLANEIGQPRLVAEMRELSDRQFELLWNFTNVATGLKSNYINAKQEHISYARENISEEYLEEAYDLIEWAKKN